MSGGALTGAEVRRERNRREMRAAILDEARTIVSEQGIDALSVRAIARNLGYSPGALYEYFRDKEAILHGLYFKGTDGLGVAIIRVVASMPEDAPVAGILRELGLAYRAHALANAEMFRLGFGAMLRPDEVEHDPADGDDQGGFGVILKVVERGLAEGVLIDLPAPVLAVTCWSLVHGFVTLEVTNHITGGPAPGELPPSPEVALALRDAAFEGALDTLLYGIVRRDPDGND